MFFWETLKVVSLTKGLFIVANVRKANILEVCNEVKGQLHHHENDDDATQMENSYMYDIPYVRLPVGLSRSFLHESEDINMCE